MKFCMAVGLGKVKTGFVCSVTKILLEFRLGVPRRDS